MMHPLLKVLVGQPVLALRRRELHRFLKQLPQLQWRQQQKLQMLLRAMRGSRFARDFGLSPQMTAADLKRALPVSGFERVAPYVSRLMEGEVGALFAREVQLLMMAQTSGTTSAVKHIPVTAATFAEVRRSWTVWGCALAKAHPQVMFSGIISLASSWQTSRTPSGLPIGSISGLLVKAMHTTMRLSNIVPPVVACVEGTQARWYLALRLALARQDVMMVTTANPSTLVAFARQLDTDKEALIRDLYDGTLRLDHAYTPKLRAGLRWRWGRRQPQRAKVLEQLAKHVLTPRLVWPQLQVLGVWTGGTLAPYLGMLPPLYGDVVLRDHGLSASEGRLTIPLDDGVPYGVLNGDGAFYEFIPLADYGGEDPPTLLAHELDEGGRYVVVVTTSGGLVRYDMGDVVECRGFLDGAPLLAFLNKGSQFANMTGEKLSAFQVVEAARSTFSQLGAKPHEFVLAPKFGEPSYYILIVAGDAAVAPQFLTLFDQQLAAGNCEYSDKRRSGRLGPLRLGRVPLGAFAARRAARLAAGGTWEQYKHPFLVVNLDSEPEFACLRIVDP